MRIDAGDVYSFAPTPGFAYLMTEGFARVLRVGPGRRESFVMHLFGGDYIPRALFDFDDNYACIIEAIISSEIEGVEITPSNIGAILLSYEAAIGRIAHHNYNLTCFDSEQRILNHLLYLTKTPVGKPTAHGDYVIQLRQSDLVKEVGLARETISKTFGRFQQMGLIRTGYREITVCSQLLDNAENASQTA